MKPRLLFITVLVLIGLFSCDSDNNSDTKEVSYFLSEIRPDFFENLNFESETVVAEIPTFLKNLYETFGHLESEYDKGKFSSTSDLENMRLASMYYAFYLLALTGNYLDGNLSFDEIQGDSNKGLFSKLDSNTDDFERLELEAMMRRSEAVILRGVNINGYNDKTFGFYIAVKQVYERLKNNNQANSEAHGNAIDYVGVRLVNYDFISNWNVLMSMVTMTNYDDPLNTFDNPRMNELLVHVNARLIPGTLPDLGGKYPEILGPLYRFDLNLKKLEWILAKNEPLDEKQLDQIDQHINMLETASNFVKTERTELLNSWIHKYTYDQRVEKLNEIKAFREGYESNTHIERPQLKSFINSYDFKRAYQCYSCHRPSGL